MEAAWLEAAAWLGWILDTPETALGSTGLSLGSFSGTSLAGAVEALPPVRRLWPAQPRIK